MPLYLEQATKIIQLDQHLNQMHFNTFTGTEISNRAVQKIGKQRKVS